jgi:hypothetical protein
MSNAADNGVKQEYFVYIGQEGANILEDVIHVRVHLFVKAIKAEAFEERSNW